VGVFFSLPKEHLLNVPNTVFGILFYIACIFYPIFTFVPFRKYLLFIASFSSLSVSFFLGYTLYFILKDFCLVCVSSYFINLAIFFISIFELRNKKIKPE